jgi:hypothetical protein
MKTKVFNRLHSDGAGGTVFNEWREAQKKPGTQSWVVRRVQEKEALCVSEQGNYKSWPVYDKKMLLNDVSFFDALYACAHYEISEFELDPQAAGKEGKNHYRALARSEGIVFDKKTELPLLVVDGVILNDDYTIAKEDEEILINAKGNTDLSEFEKLNKASALVQGVKENDDLLPVRARPLLELSSARQEEDKKQQFRRAVMQADKIDYLLDRIRSLEFKSGLTRVDSDFMAFTVLVGGFCSAGIIPLALYLANLKTLSPQKQLVLDTAKLKRMAGKISNPELRDLFNDCADSARATYYLERAGHEHRAYLRKGARGRKLRKAEGFITKAFKFVSAADQHKKEALQLALLQNDYPRAGHFFDQHFMWLREIKKQGRACGYL